ncbi:TPA: restriction endonuclease subunit S [Klebsiella pneumoniae]|uniref:restriction endonuclease subunit S n=1 Tax=Klebsiella pneumoniae complex TaxID=3390273 RepID=UPI000C7A2DCE|nr:MULTISPECIES: restriction endonuclease subunit S [Klebsiella]HBR1847713.1 restriction endonuclease subunit S [Klebsiella quasipneumoniae subsp. quasipneumoniae]HDH1364628.1 restriction endonuclease subunit S [Klebsiella quasipneumoniae subsp. similipneumoniae]EIW8570153.1 4'-phosphopantetheinyl transferase [Klebsiella pneumoniae]EKX1467978.1 restriction endonuclease subunit S [Klebsiella pneumoniae]MBC5417504.1 restriction endonuclease subunit S [Klebsiella pneumoniae]
MSEVKLPEGWCYACVGDYLYLKNGFAFKSTSYVNASEHTYPVIRISDLNGTHASDRNAVHVSAGESGFEINNGDLLIAMSGATTGKIGVYLGRTPAYQNQRVGNITLRSTKYGNAKYRDFLISSLSDTILKIAYGGAQPNISGKAIEQIKILLPPLAEQQIIADKLDDLLARVESIKTRLENIPEILKKFRQSVFSSIIIKYSSDKNSKERFSTSLGSISEDIRYGTSKKCSENEGDTAVLRIPNIGSGHIIDSNLKYAYFDEKELYTLSLKKGDLLLIRSNGSVDLVGKVAMVSEKDTGFLYAGYLIRIRLDLEMAVPEYVTYCLQSPQVRQVIENIARSTSGVNNINSKELSSLILPIPSLEEQNKVIKDVDKYLSCISIFETMADNALSRINNLTQSILAKAFRGELTAQWREENPELINGLNSAEALLEKITAEKLAAGTVKKHTKKTSR